jgi:hypothetical protein
MMALMAFLPIVLAILLLPTIFYLLTLQRALSRCAVESRTMSPGLVWLALIPVFNLVWAFFIVNALSNSLHAEFTRRGLAVEPQPARGLGLALAILCALSIVPVVNILTGIAALVCWILYWVKIAEYSARIAAPFTPPAS